MTIRRTLQGWYRFLWVALLMVGALHARHELFVEVGVEDRDLGDVSDG